jgi:hypothetical protein
MEVVLSIHRIKNHTAVSALIITWMFCLRYRPGGNQNDQIRRLPSASLDSVGQV